MRAPAAVILGSAFQKAQLGGVPLRPLSIETPWGNSTLYLHEESGGFVLFRHGVPHRYLPHQVPYRANAAALASVGCKRLLVTSSVGVLTEEIPLFEPLLVRDLMMPENRLPNGESCTIFGSDSANQGHLVLEEGLFSRALNDQLRALCDAQGQPVQAEVTFAYVPGPRTKTPAENELWRRLGAQVNSMSLGPELVLANELEIPTVALVVGHKRSRPAQIDRAALGATQALDQRAIDDSLRSCQRSIEALALAFLRESEPVPFHNRIHRL